jgi:hypothetical protein
MRHSLFVVLMTVAAIPSLAIEPRSTVEIGLLGPLTRHVAAELKQHSSSFRISDGAVTPDYRITLEPRFRNEAAQRLYRHSTGRVEDSVLFFTDVETGKDLLRFDFRMGMTDAEHLRNAREFVERTIRRLQKSD